jgi:hypothetical protein
VLPLQQRLADGTSTACTAAASGFDGYASDQDCGCLIGTTTTGMWWPTAQPLLLLLLLPATTIAATAAAATMHAAAVDAAGWLLPEAQHIILLHVGGHDDHWPVAVVCAVVCDTAQEELCHPALVVTGHHNGDRFQLLCFLAQHVAHTLCVNLRLQGTAQNTAAGHSKGQCAAAQVSMAQHKKCQCSGSAWHKDGSSTPAAKKRAF